MDKVPESQILPSNLPEDKQLSKTNHLLQVSELDKSFGGLLAVNNFSISVGGGEIAGLIGANGAGKTTVFNLISGFLRPDKGKVTFTGIDITGWHMHQICKLGLVRTFQITQPFSNLSAVENVMMGAFLHENKSSLARKKAMQVLESFALADKARVTTKELTLAEQRRLELARVVATGPKLVLLDECMAGLTPTEIHESIELIRSLKERGITFVIVEHVFPIIRTLCERVIVMHLGQKIAEGTCAELEKNQKVVESYLGEEACIA